MQILDRFSTHLKNTLSAAIQIAIKHRNPLVEPEHLLAALFEQKGSVAFDLLKRFKISKKITEEKIMELPQSEHKIGNGRANLNLLPPLSENCKKILEKTMIIAREYEHNFVGSEHLLLAILENAQDLTDSFSKQKSIEEMIGQLDHILGNASQFPRLGEMAEMIGDSLPPPPSPDFLDGPTQNATVPRGEKTKNKTNKFLETFATNLTSAREQKNIDPIIGREKEIERISQILCRRRKNNPILLGDPGVGKTAIVEGLAKKITQQTAASPLLNKKIYSLNLGLLIAGTIYRGDFESRLQGILEEVAADPDIILFIDEVHNIIGAGSNQGAMDAANLLKPALARGQIRCVGATTPEEFKKYIESDPALERRFQSVLVSPSSVEDTIQILKGVKKNYEKYHQIKITDSALEAAAFLSDRYLNDKFLPDKAVDLLDEAAAAKKMSLPPNALELELNRLKNELVKTRAEKEETAAKENFKKAVLLKSKEKKLAEEIERIKKETKTVSPKKRLTLSEKDIKNQISKILNIPAEDLFNRREKNKLAEKIKENLAGQDRIVDEVCRLVGQSDFRFEDNDKPKASFLFAGKSGVGKTELSKLLAKELYAGQDALIKLDMSEFNESFSVSKLLGSPAGYVGYKEKNLLTDQVKKRPHCVILFDEIDKAHKDVIKLLLQILEEGRITDSSGKKFSLKHAIIILTTSVCSDILSRDSFGFEKETFSREKTAAEYEKKLKDFFGTEIINRLDKVAVFNDLKKEDLKKIVELEIKKLNKGLEKYRANLKFNKNIPEQLVQKMKNSKKDGRSLSRAIQKNLRNLLSAKLSEGKIKKEYLLELEGEKLTVK